MASSNRPEPEDTRPPVLPPPVPEELFDTASTEVFANLVSKRNGGGYPTDKPASSLTGVAAIAPAIIPYLQYLETRAATDGPAMGFLESGKMTFSLPDLKRADKVSFFFGARENPSGEKLEVMIVRPHISEGEPVFSSNLRWAGKKPMCTPVNHDSLAATVRKIYEYAIETGYVAPSPPKPPAPAGAEKLPLG